VEEQIDINSLNCKVPGLLLQPLVENAIRHGLSSSSGGGILKIISTIQNGGLLITVADNGSGFADNNPFKPGHALENIRKRIRLLYGNNGTLTANRNHETGETEMTVKIPAENEG
jgi:LytS/YehU family sensor histidine kinase